VVRVGSGGIRGAGDRWESSLLLCKTIELVLLKGKSSKSEPCGRSYPINKQP
jgi:hypothetical protein